MRNTWTHLMVSDTFYFIVDDTVFCPKDDKPYCPLTLFTIQTLPKGSIIKSKMLILCGIPPHLFHLMLLFSYRFQKL